MFFQIDLESAPLFIIWDAIKASLRGHVVTHSVKIVKDWKVERATLAVHSSNTEVNLQELDLAKQKLKNRYTALE